MVNLVIADSLEGVSLAIAPLVVAAGLYGAAQLGSSLFSSAATSKANQTNLQIARETNQANRQIADLTSLRNLQNQREAQVWERENMDIQNRWNVDQWMRENSYNSPASQKARFMQAGINPNMQMMNAGLAGQLQSAGTNGFAPAQAVPSVMEAAKVDPVPTIGASLSSGISAGIQGYVGLQSQMLDNQMKRTAADYQKDQIIAGLENLRAQKEKMLSEAGLNKRRKVQIGVEIKDLSERLDYYKKMRPYMEAHEQNVVEQDDQIIKTYEHNRKMSQEANDRAWSELQLRSAATQSQLRVDNATIAKLSAEYANLRSLQEGIEEENNQKHIKTQQDRMDFVKRARGYVNETENYLKDLRKAGFLKKPEFEAALAELDRIKAQNEYDSWFRYGYKHGEKDNGFAGNLARGLNYVFNQVGQALGGGSGAAALFKAIK